MVAGPQKCASRFGDEYGTGTGGWRVWPGSAQGELSVCRWPRAGPRGSRRTWTSSNAGTGRESIPHARCHSSSEFRDPDPRRAPSPPKNYGSRGHCEGGKPPTAAKKLTVIIPLLFESVLTQIAPHRPPVVSTGLDYLHSHITIAQPTDEEAPPRSPNPTDS